jgi:hypothetical protein
MKTEKVKTEKKHTLVRGSDRVVLVVGARGAANLVLPPRANAGTRRHLDDGVVLELDVGVAGKVGVVDVLDGVVAARGADTLELALVDAVDRHALEDGVGADGRRQSDKSEGLHLGGGGGGWCLGKGVRVGLEELTVAD